MYVLLTKVQRDPVNCDMGRSDARLSESMN